jgi:ATP-dependent helicase HrpA
MTGVQIPYDEWLSKEIGQHLFMNFRVIDTDGQVLEEGRNLQTIKDSLNNSGTDTAMTISDGLEEKADDEGSAAYRQDDVGPEVLSTLGETVEVKTQGIIIKAYPCLVKKGKHVHLRVLESKQGATDETHKAIRQLFINALPEQIKHLKQSIPDIQNLCLKYTDLGRCDDLKRDIVKSVVDDVFLYDEIKTEECFKKKLEEGKSKLHDSAKQWSRLLSNILDEYRAIKKLIKNPALNQLDVVTDIQQQLNYLFPKDFISVIDKAWLQEYPRYLLAMNKRYDKSKTNASRDRQLRLDFTKLWDEYIKRQQSLDKQHVQSKQLDHYRWLLEEYRVSLFAQELKTKMPVSEKRLRKYWNDLSDI